MEKDKELSLGHVEFRARYQVGNVIDDYGIQRINMGQ